MDGAWQVFATEVAVAVTRQIFMERTRNSVERARRKRAVVRARDVLRTEDIFAIACSIGH